FDHVERELGAAVRRHAHLPWYLRLRARHSRVVIVAFAALAIAAPSLAAVGLLQTGSTVGPNVPRTPNAFEGVALKSGIELLPLRAADPAGGSPWGMRLIRTTRGLLCLQIGRAAFGKVGALGRDHAFANDGRFHPFSPDYAPGPGSACVTPDAHGNGFFNVAAFGVPASGLLGSRGQASGCVPEQSPPRHLPAAAQGHTLRPRSRHHGQLPPCPLGDLREVYYGLLGPDAASVTHRTASGSLQTTPTSGQSGAYLIVLPNHAPISANGSSTSDATLFPGAIRTVNYRDGHSCRLSAPASASDPGPGSCPPVGCVPAVVRLPTPAQVASPVSARVVFAKHYCAQRSSELIIACPTRTPPQFQRLDMSRGPAQVLVQIRFVSRIAIENGHSYYYFEMNRPPYSNPRYPSGLQCAGAGDFGQTNSDYAAGQQVTLSMFESLSCMGPVKGDVSLVITTGPSRPAPTPAVRGQSAGRDVGHFSFTLP
ncbi:MAG: hypothetical protein M3Z13_06830, partial [Candidatus Dormibacteraeota bacterium]|nr:hypothetical protein [Candidatus Dormibacteraeota bacterium]